MKKYIKNTNLVPIDNKIKIFSQLSDVSQTLDNEIVIVDGIGVFKCNGSNITKLYSDGRTATSAVVGEIRMFYGNTIPTGWLECNGSSFSSTDYPELYSLLGSTALPDYRECALRGATSSIGTFSNDSMGSHSHTTSNTAHTHSCSRSSHDHCYWLVRPINICKMCIGGCCSAPKLCSFTTSGSLVTTTSKAICGNTSGFTVGASPWASTVTRAREIGVRFIIYAGE